MKTICTVAIAATCMALGVGVGFAAKPVPPGISVIQNKPNNEAGLAALAAAEQLAGAGSWETLAVGRVYLLSGDKAKAQTLFDRVMSGKQNGSDWERLGDIYAETGDKAKAEECYQKMLALNPKDDTGQANVGAWYLRNGDRAKGEELLGKALQRHPDEMWTYLKAAEALLGVPAGH